MKRATSLKSKKFATNYAAGSSKRLPSDRTSQYLCPTTSTTSQNIVYSNLTNFLSAFKARTSAPSSGVLSMPPRQWNRCRKHADIDIAPSLITTPHLYSETVVVGLDNWHFHNVSRQKGVVASICAPVLVAFPNMYVMYDE
ncbi:hypothetical protein U1Q18_047757 [Sarracenia purpurea var. burkii]